ncbi:putative protein MSS51 homolog, mitochondrial isoform X2 [Panulirus ornatus]|uniref:putative protein MSS51 homolog, mitochondrial isoform X2 n=1 Tax=Panulirus ornatus TaxID=150431 RepID=UPI003A87001A
MEVNGVGTEPLVQLLPAIRHFHPGICHFCSQAPSESCMLKWCAQCQLVPYCSKQCQRKDWAMHKRFCQVHAVEGRRNVFSQAKIKVHDKKSWLEYRKFLQLTARINLDRRLEVFENEILLFPRVCEVCKEAEPSKIIDCPNCHSVFYCSDSHCSQDAERHEKWCYKYLLCIQCDIWEARKGIPDLPFPSKVDKEYKKLPAKMIDHLKTQLCLKNVDDRDLDLKLYAVMSERLSYPLSLLYALQQLEVGPYKQAVSELSELKIHVVGAESTKELLGIIRWEYLVHRLPALMKLHMVFVGPELFSDSGLSDELPDNRCLDDSGMTQCEDCQEKGRVIVYEMCQLLYHEYKNTNYFTSPDAIIAYNCGFHEFEGEKRDAWPESLSLMVQNSDIPLIFTSYTSTEAKKDMAVLRKFNDTEVVIPIHMNPYCSVRPIRDFTREDACDMFFINQYISCIIGKK